jgi:hypothetical protein
MSLGDGRKQNETWNIMGRIVCYLIGNDRSRKKDCRNGIATSKELKKMIVLASALVEGELSAP